MKKTFTFLIFVILILTIFVLSRQPAGYKQELEEKDRFYQGQIDSIHALIETMRARDALMVERLSRLKDSLNTAQITANQWKLKYDRQKRNYRPIPDPVLDSLINSYR
jgi:hypothetical protein